MLESHRSLVFLLKPGKYSKNKMSESIVVTFTEGHAGERKKRSAFCIWIDFVIIYLLPPIALQKMPLNIEYIQYQYY